MNKKNKKAIVENTVGFPKLYGSITCQENTKKKKFTVANKKFKHAFDV